MKFRLIPKLTAVILTLILCIGCAGSVGYAEGEDKGQSFESLDSPTDFISTDEKKEAIEKSGDLPASFDLRSVDTDGDGGQVDKADNPLSVKSKIATIKYKKLRKKSVALAASKVIRFKNKGVGEKIYTLSSARKGRKSFKRYFKVNPKTGKITVKKRLKKGTYKVTVKVKAAGNDNYKSVVKKVTFKIRVK